MLEGDHEEAYHPTDLACSDVHFSKDMLYSEAHLLPHSVCRESQTVIVELPFLEACPLQRLLKVRNDSFRCNQKQITGLLSEGLQCKRATEVLFHFVIKESW